MCNREKSLILTEFGVFKLAFIESLTQGRTPATCPANYAGQAVP